MKKHLAKYFTIMSGDPKSRRTPIRRTLFIRIANYHDRLGHSGKHFLTTTVLHHFMTSFFPPTDKYIRGLKIKFANLILVGLFIKNLYQLDSQPSLLFGTTEKAA